MRSQICLRLPLSRLQSKKRLSVIILVLQIDWIPNTMIPVQYMQEKSYMNTYYELSVDKILEEKCVSIGTIPEEVATFIEAKKPELHINRSSNIAFWDNRIAHTEEHKDAFMSDIMYAILTTKKFRLTVNKQRAKELFCCFFYSIGSATNILHICRQG